MPIFAVASFEKATRARSGVCMLLTGAESRENLLRDQLTRWLARGRTADEVCVECIEITPEVFAQLQRSAPDFKNSAPESLGP